MNAFLISVCLLASSIQENTSAPKLGIITGEDEGTRFGKSLLAIGDYDGDKVDDFLVGASVFYRPGESQGWASQNWGIVWVYSGKTRKPIDSWEGEKGRPQFGDSLKSMGDVNGDGIGDVAVGYGVGLRTEVRSGEDGALLYGLDCHSSDVACLGDYDGDGSNDFGLIGKRFLEVRTGLSARFLDGPNYFGSRDKFWILDDRNQDGLADGLRLGKSSGWSYSSKSVAATRFGSNYFKRRAPIDLNHLWKTSEGEPKKAVTSLVDAGDLNGDGEADVLITVSSNPGTINVRRELHAISFKKPKEPLFTIKDKDQFWIPSSDSREFVGLAQVDLNGDKVPDFVLGNGSSALFITEVRSYSGKNGSLLWTHELTGEITVGNLFSFSHWRDEDGDGIQEVLVGRCDGPWHGPVYQGSVRLLSGATGKLLWKVVDPGVR